MEYRYGMRLRGFSIGAQPRNSLLRAENDPSGKYHSIVVYSRHLNEEELSDYELDDLNDVERSDNMDKNLNTMKCDELRVYARELGIKGGNSRGKAWLIPAIEAELFKREQEAARKETEEKKVRSANLLKFNGKSQSVGAWAKELGMPVATLRARLRNGWTVEQALSKASAGKGGNMIEFNGKSQTLSAWARELSVPRPTLAARLYRLNWTPEKAFTMVATIG